MTKKQKAEIVQSTLERLYPAPPIPLKHKDPFTLLISVLLSAQTTDAMVNRVTPALFAVADTPKKMMHLSPEQIREIIGTMRSGHMIEPEKWIAEAGQLAAT